MEICLCVHAGTHTYLYDLYFPNNIRCENSNFFFKNSGLHF